MRQGRVWWLFRFHFHILILLITLDGLNSEVFFFFFILQRTTYIKKKTIHNLDIVLNNDIDDFTNLKFNSNHFASYQNYNHSINLFQIHN